MSETLTVAKLQVSCCRILYISWTRQYPLNCPITLLSPESISYFFRGLKGGATYEKMVIKQLQDILWRLKVVTSSF